MRDFLGVITQYGEEKDKPLHQIYEDIRDCKYIDKSFYDLDEAVLDEAVGLPAPSEIKVCKEKYGTGVKFKLGKVTYKYISDKMESVRLAEVLRVIASKKSLEDFKKWLKANAVCYWNSVDGDLVDDFSESKLEPEEEGSFFQKGDSYYILASDEEKDRRFLDTKGRVVGVKGATRVSYRDVPQNIRDLLRNKYEKWDEAEVTADVGCYYLVGGKKHKVIDVLNEDIYVEDENNETWVMTREEFSKGAKRLDEAQSLEEVFAKKIKKAAGNWKCKESIDKEGNSSFVISDGKGKAFVLNANIYEDTCWTYNELFDKEMEGSCAEAEDFIKKNIKLCQNSKGALNEETMDLYEATLDVAVVGVESGMFVININDKRYGYTSENFTPKELMEKFQSIMKHNAGAALSWLKKNAKTKDSYSAKKGQGSSTKSKPVKEKTLVDKGKDIIKKIGSITVSSRDVEPPYDDCRAKFNRFALRDLHPYVGYTPYGDFPMVQVIIDEVDDVNAVYMGKDGGGESATYELADAIVEKILKKDSSLEIDVGDDGVITIDVGETTEAEVERLKIPSLY